APVMTSLLPLCSAMTWTSWPLMKPGSVRGRTTVPRSYRATGCITRHVLEDNGSEGEG
ncbi:hypothetical protein JYU34_020544, partial [Plutella xylostella]